jgi:prepilin peptidase CpaA
MNISHLIEQFQFHILVHGQQYKLYIEAATVAVLVYVGFTDFLTFKIRNDVVLLLVVLYVMFAIVDRSRIEIVMDVILAVIMFGVLVYFYAQGGIGGGDVKLLTVAALWVGTDCAVPFSVLFLLFVGLHLLAVWMRWAKTTSMKTTSSMNYRLAIPCAPAVAAALIGIIVLGYL